ncbi:MAG: SPOR domain-containing protein [Saprospiraceae bacterium]|nr:SPOR domain-containing protein [Bacteroidia bacterium]NNE14863.1 SPOR domain-containing protein [Saprospiraceae bacterium]NNL91905.1 SPOR domain-containing protein [Saprospiraceae bacterium]
MNRLLKILVSILALSLFYIWMSSVFQSCQNKKNDNDGIEMLNDSLDDGEELLEEVDEELFEDDDLGLSDDDSEEESYVEFEDEPFEDEPSKSTSKKSSTTKSTTSSSSGSSGGQYLLISGNYLVETNADKMKSKLKNMGYNNAEIAIFNGSNYRTVIASRYSSYSDALQAASSLKEKGIDCYVKKKS